jgi:hypothetical protein
MIALLPLGMVRAPSIWYQRVVIMNEERLGRELSGTNRTIHGYLACIVVFLNMHRAMEFGLEEACLLEFCQLGKS